MSELLNKFENVETASTKKQEINSGENPEIQLTKKHSTFFSLSSDDKTNKEKIDNAQKTLDSIYHVCEEQQNVEKKNKIQTNNDPNDHIVMTGTDYHGDRRSFQAGVISELVQWKKNEFLVMDVTDGEILYTGTIDNIKDDLTNIREKLAEKNKKHHDEIKDKLKKIITDGIDPYMRKITQLKDFSCTVESGVLTITHKKLGSIEVDMESTDDPNKLGLINILTDMNANNKRKKILLYNLIGEQWHETFGSLEGKPISPYQCLVDFFKHFFTPRQKIALVHDFELNKDFDPTKKSVVLTGDYIDRGEGSCEILCMISNIQKKISEDKLLKDHKDCFIATSGNHESNSCARNDESNPVNNCENDCYANRLAKKMMKDGKLVSGHIIKSDKDNDDKKFYSFSHTFILKTDCYLIMRQIFELEELMKNINNENWLNDTNNKNEFVMATKEICGGKVNNYGKQILKSLADRYQTVRKSEKYKKALEKVIQNKNLIDEKLRYYDGPIFKDKKILESGRQFYDDLKDIFSDEDFFQLRYLSMDALVYPIVASDTEKWDLISKGLKDGKIDIKSASQYNNLAFSDFFCRKTKTTPKCLKSILAISNEKEPSSPNCLNWNRFFKGITQDDILSDVKQFVGHDPLSKGEFMTFHSNIVETDFEQSAGYQKTSSLIDKTFINISNPEKSCTCKYEVSNINTEKPTVSNLPSHRDLFNDKSLKHDDNIIEYSLSSLTTPLLKKILIVFGILFALVGIALLIWAEALALTIGSVLLGIGAVGLFITIFFYNKIDKKIYDSHLKTYDTNFVTLNKNEPNKIQEVIKDSEGKKEEEINTDKKNLNNQEGRIDIE